MIHAIIAKITTIATIITRITMTIAIATAITCYNCYNYNNSNNSLIKAPPWPLQGVAIWLEHHLHRAAASASRPLLQ